MSQGPPPGYQQQYGAPPAGQGYAPPPGQQGYAPPPGQQGYAQPQHVTVVTSTPQAGPGTCPSCHVGYIREDFTGLGICLAIFFFPLGILCCLAMKERRCSHCGASF